MQHILARTARQDGSLVLQVLYCMFVAGMGEGYLKNEDVTEPDLFDVKVNHSSVVARKGLQGGFFLVLVFSFFCLFGIVTVLEL